MALDAWQFIDVDSSTDIDTYRSLHQVRWFDAGEDSILNVCLNDTGSKRGHGNLEPIFWSYTICILKINMFQLFFKILKSAFDTHFWSYFWTYGVQGKVSWYVVATGARHGCVSSWALFDRTLTPIFANNPGIQWFTNTCIYLHAIYIYIHTCIVYECM